METWNDNCNIISYGDDNIPEVEKATLFNTPTKTNFIFFQIGLVWNLKQLIGFIFTLVI